MVPILDYPVNHHTRYLSVYPTQRGRFMSYIQMQNETTNLPHYHQENRTVRVPELPLGPKI